VAEGAQAPLADALAAVVDADGHRVVQSVEVPVLFLPIVRMKVSIGIAASVSI
jgi:hypothetical protein